MADEKAPIGIAVLNYICCYRLSTRHKNTFYRCFIFVATFFCYTTYHLSRKPISVVKPQLRPKCSNATKTDCGGGWAPFDEEGGQQLLGTLDYGYVFSYAIGMYFSGHVAERMDKRYFLALGMQMSGLMTAVFGFAYYLNIHHFAFFISVQVVGGLFQSTGWPSVVAIMGNWFGKERRGFIFGVWAANSALGNILGSLVSAAFVRRNWGMSFLVPAFIISATAIAVLLFLVTKPEHVGCSAPDHDCIAAGGGTEDNLYKDAQADSVGNDVGHGVGIAASGSSVHAEDLGKSGPSVQAEDPTKSGCGVQAEDPTKSGSGVQAEHLGKSGCSVQAEDLGKSGSGVQAEDLGKSGCSVQAEDLGKSGSSMTNGLESQIGSRLDTQEDVENVPNETTALIKIKRTSSSCEREQIKAVTIFGALKIYGVVEYSLCMFFAKLVNYTFLYWLPTFIHRENGMDPEKAGYLSTLYDVGGILGGIIAGAVSDYTRSRACTCVVMLLLAAPLLFLYSTLAASSSIPANLGMLMGIGAFASGPCSLITTAVSADLGTHPSLRGSNEALATVTAIIDGTGSIGAAIGPFIAGVIPTAQWNILFLFLMSSDLLAAFLLSRIVRAEIRTMIGRRKRRQDAT